MQLHMASDLAPCVVFHHPGQQAEEGDGSPPAGVAVQRAWLPDPAEVSPPALLGSPRVPLLPPSLSPFSKCGSLITGSQFFPLTFTEHAVTKVGIQKEKSGIISEHRARTWIPEAGKGPFLRSVEVYAPVVEKSIECFCVPTSSSPPESHMHKNKTSSFLSPHSPENGTSSGGLHRGREHPCTVLPR